MRVEVTVLCVQPSVTMDGTVEVCAVEGSGEVLAETVPHVEPALALDREPLGDEPVATSSCRR